jgi:hypothetical protein
MGEVSANLLIVLATTFALNGRLAEPQANYCLRFVREIVEYAYGLEPGEFYRLWWTHRVPENKTAEPWARDMERSFRAQGFGVPQARAGDLVFNYRVAIPYGHVGVMITDQLVLDVWPEGSSAILRLVPLYEWNPTTIVRLPDR